MKVVSWEMKVEREENGKSKDYSLVIEHEDGEYIVYDVQGNPLRDTFKTLAEAKAEVIAQCDYWGYVPKRKGKFLRTSFER